MLTQRLPQYRQRLSHLWQRFLLRWNRVAPTLIPRLVTVGVLIAGLWYIERYRFQINPDGISYISIAQHVLDGHWYEAINAYWGPLFSWLLVPLLALGLDGLYAAKVLSTLIAAATVWPAWVLLGRVSRRLLVRTGMLLAAVPFLLWWSVCVLTPDSLVVLFTVAYLAVQLSPDYLRQRRLHILVGALGALGFLAKSYGFPLFLAHVTLFHAFHWWMHRPDRRVWLRTWTVAVGTFLVISVPWIVTISVKFGAPTIGTSANYNIGFAGPKNTLGHPVSWQGLMEPPHPYALSGWEDPSHTAFPPWPGFRESAQHVWKLVRQNASIAWGIVRGIEGAVLAVLMVAILIAFERRRTGAESRNLGWILATMLVYPLGFLPLYLEERYIWTEHLLVIILTAGVVEAILDRIRVRWFLVLVLVLGTAWSFGRQPLRQWQRSVHMGEEFAARARLLSGSADFPAARVATLDDWHGSLYLCYHLRCGAYLGMLRNARDASSVLQQLREHRVDTLFVLGTLPWDPAALEEYRRTEAVAPGAPAIYRRTLTP